MFVGNKRSFMLKQTSSFPMQGHFRMCELLLSHTIKGSIKDVRELSKYSWFN